MGVFITEINIACCFPAPSGSLGSCRVRDQIAVNADNGGGFDGSGDRVILGTLAAYNGGPATMSRYVRRRWVLCRLRRRRCGNIFVASPPLVGRTQWLRSGKPGGDKTAGVFLQSYDVNGGTSARGEGVSCRSWEQILFPRAMCGICAMGFANIFDVNLVSSHWGRTRPVRRRQRRRRREHLRHQLDKQQLGETGGAERRARTGRLANGSSRSPPACWPGFDASA